MDVPEAGIREGVSSAYLLGRADTWLDFVGGSFNVAAWH